jgi:Zn-dependent protease
LTGLEQFVQANPASAITGMNMLGWSLFLGLASLFVAPIFDGGRLAKTIKWALIVNGACCLLGGVSYIYEFSVGVFLFITFGMGGAVTVATLALGTMFGRLGRSTAAYLRS